MNTRTKPHHDTPNDWPSSPMFTASRTKNANSTTHMCNYLTKILDVILKTKLDPISKSYYMYAFLDSVVCFTGYSTSLGHLRTLNSETKFIDHMLITTSRTRC